METVCKVWAEIQRLAVGLGRLLSRWLKVVCTMVWEMLRPVVFPFAAYRDRILRRVGGIIAERLAVIRDEWKEDIEGLNTYPDYAAARQRGRVREVNAILAQIQREFPSFSPEIAIDPFEMQSDIHEEINARKEVVAITAQRVVGRPVKVGL